MCCEKKQTYWESGLKNGALDKRKRVDQRRNMGSLLVNMRSKGVEEGGQGCFIVSMLEEVQEACRYIGSSLTSRG